MSEKYIRFNANGTMQVVQEVVQELSVSSAILDRFSSKVHRRVKAAFTIMDNPCSLIITDAECYAVVDLVSLRILSHYQVGNDKVLRPVFLRASDGEEKGFPMFPADWLVPSNMRLRFAARIHEYNSDKPYTHYDHACYLLAYDNAGRCFRLPLPNLFEDGAMCMGKFDCRSDSIQSAMQSAVDQLARSDWNADLMSTYRQQCSDALFQFQPDNEAIKCIPFGGDWMRLSEKIVTPITDIIGGAA